MSDDIDYYFRKKDETKRKIDRDQKTERSSRDGRDRDRDRDRNRNKDRDGD